jgi:peroxiredoxin
MPDDEGRLQPHLIPGQAYAIRARRPASLRIEEIRADPVMQAAIEHAACCAGSPFDVFVSDGRRQYELNTTSNVYVEGEAASTLAEIQAQYGLPTVLAVDQLFAAEPLEGFELVGEEEMDENPFLVYSLEQAQDGERTQQRLYLAREDGLPRRMSILEMGGLNAWTEVMRIDYSDWAFDVALPDATFDATPPSDARPQPPPSPWFDPLLKPGSEPTPLNTTDLAGIPISFEEYRGHVVLVDYWATWCHPCRIEMLRLKALYEQYHSQGLEVIGISLDEEAQRERMQEFLKEKAIPWRQICDGQGFRSPLATAYQVGAIPFTLLLGRDGKIAAVNARGDELEEAIRHGLATK